MAIRVHGFKRGPNDACPCKSGKKFKKCCQWKFEKAVRDGCTTDQQIAESMIDPFKLAEREKAEVLRFKAAMANDPSLVPGDTVLKWAEKYRIDLGPAYTPERKPAPATVLMAVMAVGAILQTSKS